MHLSFLVQGNFSILFGKSMVQLTKKQWMTMQCYQFPVIVLCISLHFVRYGRGNAPNLLLVRLVHPNYMFKNSIHIIFPMLSILSSSFSLYCFLYADLALSHQRSESPLFFSFLFFSFLFFSFLFLNEYIFRHVISFVFCVIKYTSYVSFFLVPLRYSPPALIN
jgi:hypothetical protein